MKKIVNNSGSDQAQHVRPMKFNIQGKEIQEIKLITEGGYGYIWLSQDIRTQEKYALKRMICQNEERIKLAKDEMKYLKMLPKHENLIGFYGGDFIQIENGVMAIYLLELCTGGSLFDMMEANQQSKFGEQNLIYIIQQACRGLQAMHSFNPPLTHRDIKIENILLNQKKFKLCDFGSCSSDVINLSQIPQNLHYKYQEVFEKYTTPMYRPPEMCDLYAGYVVDCKVDIWMLGCVLYTLCFFVHPFLECQKLAITQAKYFLPETHAYSDKLIDLIRHMLTPNPHYRPSASDLLKILDNWDKISKIQLNEQAQQMKLIQIQQQHEQQQQEKQMRPLKKFDGDIPMDELLRIQQQIQQEQEEGTFIKKKVQKPMKKDPIVQQGSQQINVQQQSQQVQKGAQQQSINKQAENIWDQYIPQNNNTQQSGWNNQNFDYFQNTNNQQSKQTVSQGKAIGLSSKQTVSQDIWDMSSFSSNLQNSSPQIQNNIWDLKPNSQQKNDYSNYQQNQYQISENQLVQKPKNDVYQNNFDFFSENNQIKPKQAVQQQKQNNQNMQFEDLIGISQMDQPKKQNILDLQDLKF